MHQLRAIHHRHPSRTSWLGFCAIVALAGELGLIFGKIVGG